MLLALKEDSQMDQHCLKCDAHLASPWKFCPNCGAAATHELHKPAESEKAPLQGPFSGLLFGVLAAPVMIIVGTMLCLTGLGAFLGVPMIIGGVLAPLAGPMIGFGAVKGKCPCCDAPVSSIPGVESFHCEACHQRIAVRDEKFVTAV
jgi:predicted amidophosphoribosyltransferase